jgi:hypothetical protein
MLADLDVPSLALTPEGSDVEKRMGLVTAAVETGVDIPVG